MTTRYNQLIDGDLGLTFTSTPTNTVAQLDLANPHGDTAATLNLPAGGTSPSGTAATGIDTWSSYTEYGQPLQAPDTATGGVTGVGYGWLGALERATINTGFTLMGARLYNPATALFTSTDPVRGGNTTPYTYPQDPVNNHDATGLAPPPPNKAERRHCARHPVQCAVYLTASRWAWSVAEKRFPAGPKGNGARRNAYRHMIWQARLVYELGWDAAYTWAGKHEYRYTDEKDHRADLYNNSSGRVIGLRARNIYKKVRGSFSAALRFMKREAIRNIDAGRYRKN